MSDIEIYVLADNGSTQAWIADNFGPLRLVNAYDSAEIFRSLTHDFSLTVTRNTDLEGATGYFISGSNVPWDSDKKLAQEVRNALSLDVAYDSGSPGQMELITDNGTRHLDV